MNNSEAMDSRQAMAAASATQAGPTAVMIGRDDRAPSRWSPEHLRYLDGLRGVAILMVLMIHASQAVSGLPDWARDGTFYGVRGVQLFFIVSGLTLTLNHAGRPFMPGDFAARRFFRIAPMFYAGAALYLILVATTAMDLPTRQATAADVAVTLLFLHGWVPSAINTVVPGGWSIAAEAMFYVLFPAILLLTPHPRTFAAAVAGSYLVAGLTNVALRHSVGAAGAALAFDFWLVQLPAFATGCWLATLPRRAEGRRAALAVLAAAMLGMIVDSQLRGHSNLLVAIVLLAAMTWAVGLVRPKLLEGRLLPLIGRISFSFYILHFAVLGLLRPLAHVVEARVGAGPACAVMFSLTFLIAAPLSWATFIWIEQPAIRFGRRVRSGRSRMPLMPST